MVTSKINVGSNLLNCPRSAENAPNDNPVALGCIHCKVSEDLFAFPPQFRSQIQEECVLDNLFHQIRKIFLFVVEEKLIYEFLDH